MTGSFRPRLLHDAAVPRTDPRTVVEAFLAALGVADLHTARNLLDEQVVYVNVGMPAIRGRRRTIGVLRPLARRGISLEIYLHAIAADGPTVLTDRTDVLVVGPVHVQFWVTGRFEVVDGLITLWRDSFDYVDMLRAIARGLVGAVVPGLRPAPPDNAEIPPGRH